LLTDAPSFLISLNDPVSAAPISVGRMPPHLAFSLLLPSGSERFLPGILAEVALQKYKIL
jgi:hypothetical protein